MSKITLAVDIDSIEELQNIIEYHNKMYEVLNSTEFPEADIHQKCLLKLTSGFGMSNALYEKFSKTIMKIYCNTLGKKIDFYIRHKSIGKIEDFIEAFKLNLENQFNLKKSELNNLNVPIQNYNELLSRFKNSYHRRNYYLHGDFRFDEVIDREIFESCILELMRLQIFTIKLLKNAFITELPNYLANCEEH